MSEARKPHSEPVDIATMDDATSLIRGTAIEMRRKGFTKSADILDASLAYLEEQLEAERLDRSTWREGMVTVYDHEGAYVGCMGRESWDWLLEQGYEKCRASVEQLEAAEVALREMVEFFDGTAPGSMLPDLGRIMGRARAVLNSNPAKRHVEDCRCARCIGAPAWPTVTPEASGDSP